MAAGGFIPVWGQESNFPLALSRASLLPEPRSSQSFAPRSTAHREPQPGFKHLGIVSLGVPEPTEQLVVLSWTHSHAPCSARELAPGSCEPLGAMSISQPRHCWPGSAALWHGMAECHLPASPRGPGPLPAGLRRAAGKCWRPPGSRGLGTGKFPSRRGEHKGARGVEVKHRSSSKSSSRDPASAKVNTFNIFPTCSASH